MSDNLALDFDHLSIGRSIKDSLKRPSGKCKYCMLKRSKHRNQSFYAAAMIRTAYVRSICKCKVIRHKSIRPGKLRIQQSHDIKSTSSSILKPAVLNVILENQEEKCEKGKLSILKAKSMPSVTEGKMLNMGKEQSDFKSLIQSDDTDTENRLKSFNSVSFKRLRSKSPEREQSNVSHTTKKDKHRTNCSIQARLESSLAGSCDDTTIDELASYFDLFVHIPKKMSTMAEMMYI